MDLIAVATAGDVDAEAMDAVEDSLETLLGASTRRIDPLPDPAHAFDEARGQYSSTHILRDALPRRPKDVAKLLVLTECDIFIPMFSFVYGQAQLDGEVAVLSFARLRQSFYGIAENRPLFLSRVRKEALHEMGHTFGLTHCDDVLCAMALSTNIRQLDVKQAAYCGSCSSAAGYAVASAVDRSLIATISGVRT